MRVYVLCIYWTLLLVSVVSSGFLFLLVTLEGAQAQDPSFHLENETYEAYNNVTLNYDNHESFESSIVPNTETHAAVTFKTNQNNWQEEATAVSASFETINDVQEKKDADVPSESLVQQANLSQEISETSQAVVLTLVDTAATELQNLVEPKDDREFSSGSSIKNASLLNNQSRQSEHPTTSTIQISSPPIGANETTERSNDTDVSEKNEGETEKISSEEAPEIVTVGAEQKANMDKLDLRVEEEEEEEEEEVGQVSVEELPTKIDDAFTVAPELNDTAARAQLIDGSRDESSAVILDGLVTSGPTDPHEDIPSFSEWAQKRLEEAEKKKTHPNVSVQTPGGSGRGVSGMKIRSKNYASPDCGAKIVAANPEASSAKNVLVSTRDEYMLNACTSRIWFVVELCEAIQAKKIELANFELFSSSPKDFSVYVSDRYPTKDWSLVGQFTAKDIKDTQSFVLHSHFFGKFIKVELQSHYGSEHFCPVSLFRAYGTSEFEVLETETENQILQETSADEDDYEDSDKEELLDSDDDSPPRNLFGSARDAVLNIMKKAAEVLVKSSDLTGNNITEIQQNIDSGGILKSSYMSCMTPRYTILCGNCTDQKFASVFQLVSCRNRQLDSLLRIDLMNKTLRRHGVCDLHGVEIESFWIQEEEKRDDTTYFNLVEDLQTTFLLSVFKPEYIVALCNVLATKERKVVMNTSYEISVNNSKDAVNDDILSIGDSDHSSEITSHHISAIVDPNSLAGKTIVSSRETRRHSTQDISEETSTITIETSASTESLASQIKPTKTLSKEDLKKSSVPILEPSKELMEETLQAEVLTTVPPSNPTPILNVIEEPSIQETPVEMTSQTVSNILPMSLDNQEVSDTLVPDAESSEANAQIKTNKSENGEPDGKEKMRDLGEQEVRLSSQDHIALDTLFSDLKNLEGDAANMQNGASSSSSSMTLPVASTAPQKESVFLRLSNRIKILERNMSLSGQYLEELSRRYKKQVEEMQRSLERAVAAMNEESRKSEKREAKRLKEITALRKEIAVLSNSFNALNYSDQNWPSRFYSIFQHALLVLFEVIIILIFLFFIYRRVDEDEEEETLELEQDGTMRRMSADNFDSYNRTKKTKKRRPSEIASQISGTYHELMINEPTHEITKKERRKKRKKEMTVGARTVSIDAKRDKNVLDVVPVHTSGTTFRRASSTDPPSSKELQMLSKRPESAPEGTTGCTRCTRITRIARINEQKVEQKMPIMPNCKRISGAKSEPTSELDRQVNELGELNLSLPTMNRFAEESATVERKTKASTNSSCACRNSVPIKDVKLSPAIVKIALEQRDKLLSKLNSNESWKWNCDDLNDRSASCSYANLNTQTVDVNPTTPNGLNEESDGSRSSNSATPTSCKKEKRGLKKMVRKFF